MPSGTGCRAQSLGRALAVTGRGHRGCRCAKSAVEAMDGAARPTFLLRRPRRLRSIAVRSAASRWRAGSAGTGAGSCAPATIAVRWGGTQPSAAAIWDDPAGFPEPLRDQGCPRRKPGRLQETANIDRRAWRQGRDLSREGMFGALGDTPRHPLALPHRCSGCPSSGNSRHKRPGGVCGPPRRLAPHLRDVSYPPGVPRHVPRVGLEKRGRDLRLSGNPTGVQRSWVHFGDPGHT